MSRKEKQAPIRQPRQQGEHPAVRREGSPNIKRRQIGIPTGKESFLSSGTEGKARTARTPSEPCGDDVLQPEPAQLPENGAAERNGKGYSES